MTEYNYMWVYIQEHPQETKRLLGLEHQQLLELIAGSSRKRDKWKCVEGRNSLDNRKSLYRSTRGNIIL